MTEEQNILSPQAHTIKRLETELDEARKYIAALEAELEAERQDHAKSITSLRKLITFNELGDTLKDFLFPISKLFPGRMWSKISTSWSEQGGPANLDSPISKNIFSLARSAYDPTIIENSVQHRQQYWDIVDLIAWYTDRCNSSHCDPWNLTPLEYFNHLRKLENGLLTGEYQFTRPGLVEASIRAIRHLIKRDFWLNYNDRTVCYRSTGEKIPTSPRMNLDVFARTAKK